ncbi:MAG: hypothetical protein V4772_08540 [Pseudomonadota bacterium]
MMLDYYRHRQVSEFGTRCLSDAEINQGGIKTTLKPVKSGRLITEPVAYKRQTYEDQPSESVKRAVFFMRHKVPVDRILKMQISQKSVDRAIEILSKELS